MGTLFLKIAMAIMCVVLFRILKRLADLEREVRRLKEIGVPRAGTRMR